MALRPLTEQEIRDYEARGWDMSKYDGSPIEFPDPPPTSAVAAGARSAAASIVPTVAGGAGFAGGMAGGAALGGMAGLSGGPLALVSVPAGLIVGGLAGYAAGKAQEAVLPDNINQQLATDYQEHPTASMVGSLATMPLGGMNPSSAGPKAIMSAIARRSVNPQEIGIAARQALNNSIIGASLGAIQTGVEEKLHGQDLDPAAIARSAAVGTVFTSPNAIGRSKLMRFHPLSERTMDAPEKLRSQLRTSEGQVVSNEREPVVKLKMVDPALNPVEIVDATKKAETPAQVARAPKIDPSNMSDAEVKTKLIELGRPAEYVNKISPEFARRILAEGIKAQEPTNTKTPYTLEIEQKLKEAELNGMSQEYIDTLRDELLAPHRVTPVKDSNLGAKGQAFVTPKGQRIAKWNPTKVSPDTLPHEDWHHAYADWNAKAAAGDKQAARDIAHLERLSKPGLDAINEKRVEAGKKPWSLEEFIVSEQGNEFLNQQLDLGNETGKTGWTKWVNDTKALLATRGENPTLEQARRAANFRRVNEVTPEGKAPMFGPAKMQDDEQQSKDFIQYNNLVNSLKGKSLTEAVPIAIEIEAIKNKYGGKPPTQPFGLNPEWRQDQREEIDGLYRRNQDEDAERVILAAAKTTDTYKQWKLKQAKQGLPTDNDAFRDAMDNDDALQADMETEPAFIAAIEQSVTAQQNEVAPHVKVVKSPEGFHVPIAPKPEQKSELAEPAHAKEIPVATPKTSTAAPKRTEQQIYDDRIAAQQQREARQAAERLAKEKPMTMDEIKERNKELLKKLGVDTTADQLDAEKEVGRVVARTTAAKMQGPPTWDEMRPQWTKDIVAADAAKVRDSKRKAIEESNRYLAERKRQGRFQEEDDGLTTRSIKLLTNPREAKLPFNNANAANGDQLLGSLRNQLSPVEYDMLKQAGIEQAWGGKVVGQKDALEWVKNNGPKVKVETYGMEGKVSDAKREYDRMTHEWYEKLTATAQSRLRSYEQYSMPDYLKMSDIDKATADKYLQLKKQVASEPRDTSPRATSAYEHVSALPTNEPMPEWTASKEGKNVQRVDVVIPNKVKEGDKTYRVKGTNRELVMPELTDAEYRQQKADGRWNAYDVEAKKWVKIATDTDLVESNVSHQQAEKQTIWQPDNLHENLPNTLGWAMIQYKTGPKGEKIGLIAEHQDYHIRKNHEDGTYSLRVENYTKKYDSWNEANKVLVEKYPILKDRARLITKAAIEQARKEGATHIMVSDAETAMMTEGHDLQSSHMTKMSLEQVLGAYRYDLARDKNNTIMRDYYGDDWKQGKYMKHGELSYPVRVDKPEANTIKDYPQYAREMQPYYEQGKRWVAQEPGMRLNYDTILPKIAEELTGSKGEMVSLGEHKNAIQVGMRLVDNLDTKADAIADMKASGRNENEVTIKQYGPNNWGYESNVGYRKNLIFRNPDGTPKTDVSGRMFDIRPVSERLAKGDKFTLFNKYQGEDEGLDPWVNKEKPLDLTGLNKKIDEDFNKYDKLGIAPPRDELRTVDQVSQMNEDLQTGKNWSRNQEDEGLRANDMTKQGLWRGASASFDRVREVSIPIAEAFKRWEAYRDKIWGHAQTSIKDLQSLSKKDVDKAFALHREIFRHAKESEVEAKLRAVNSGSGDVAKASRLLTKYYHDKIGNIRRELGYRHDGRLAGLNKSYVPDVLNDRVMDIFVNKSQSPEAEQLKTAWANHVFKEAKGGLKMADIRSNINGYINALGGSRNNYNAVDFGALRKAEGYGLPESMREVDAVKALSKYGRRAANDMAMFKELEMNPRIANALHLWNPVTNKRHVGFDENVTINQATQIKDAMKWVTGNFSSTMSRSTPQVQSAVRVVNNALLGTATGLRDTISIPMNAIPYITSFADLGAFMKGVSNFRRESRNALETAAKQPNLDKLQFETIADAPDKFSAVANSIATGLRRYQGREALENFNRDVTFAAGKELAKQWIIGAKAGHAGSKEMLKKFDTLVDGDVTKMSGKQLEDALNQIGKNFTDRNQGTYGGRGLPTWMVDSQFAPFFALQKWSIEKSNVIYKDVIKPAVEGKNFVPLLTYTAGTLLTGAAIQKLNELLTNRKAQDPTITEALEAKTPHALASELATVMQLGSFMGIVGDGMKAISDFSHGKTPRNIVSFPTASFVADTGERTMQMIEAIQNGENAFDVITQYSIDLMTKNVQAARMIANHTLNEDNVERSDKFRDMRVFSELEGKPARAIATTNPYMNYSARQFKQTSDVNEAASMLPELVQSVQQQHGQDYEELATNLRRLKSNSYQTFPSPERQPAAFQRYYKYLVATQGKDEADKRLQDYMHQQALNQIKSSMIPSL